MKIEKVNDHQIRCTLTRADLADRQLKLSELAYGTEKAKNLFRDMIRQASINFGFEAEDIPLMIEAIPLNSDCIVLIITKVEDPEELDTRFSRFAPSVMDDEEEDYEYDYDDTEEDGSLDHVPHNESAIADKNELINLFNRIRQEAANIIGATPEDVSVSVTEIKENGQITERSSDDNGQESVTKIFAFNSMREVITPAAIVKELYDDDNSLYKNALSGQYLLVLGLKSGSKDAFNKTCNILSEYGKLKTLASVSESYFDEHYEAVIKGNALQTLSKIG